MSNTEVVGGVAMCRCACGTSIIAMEAPLSRYRSVRVHQATEAHQAWRRAGGMEQRREEKKAA